MDEVARRKDYCMIEEIEREVRRLFGNEHKSIPIEVSINDFIQTVNNIKSRIEIVDNIEPKRKIVVKKKK